MNPRSPQSKILAREAIAARWAEQGRPGTVVLANGLFDLVHVGHARYLAAARRAGDLLVVALNSDDSARRYKGPGRPLLPLAERMTVIAALEAVDLVTWFDELSVAATLQGLRPDLHAKGTDYRPETLPAEEQALHRELGIEVVIVGDPKDHATTDIIRAIARGS
ncbi:MAG: adenylyltransferase/cytidyltransferase family protein [Acidobacteriota bacterium]|nr:adenylyltransferase/cytidyltransferase family protein [Acidobacteriota bacterium]